MKGSEQLGRYKAVIAYDGSEYNGYQVQPNVRTIQGDIERALTRMAKNEFVRIHGSGRTDAGVHAKGQVIHFDLPFEIDEKGIQKGLNAQLSKEIRILSVEKTSEDFHARYDAVKKIYTYKVDMNDISSPFLRNYTGHHPYSLDFQKIDQAIQHLQGEHDFTSFSSAKTEVVDKVRILYEISYYVDKTNNILTIQFVGSGFLYNMVRILVGTLLSCGDGQLDVDQIPVILEAKDRKFAGKTASARGLYLEEVVYH